MGYNESTSARINRRNKCGYCGIGTIGSWIKTSPFGDYTDIMQNGKLPSFEINKRRNHRSISNGYISPTKKYFDNKQKVTSIVKAVYKKIKLLLSL